MVKTAVRKAGIFIKAEPFFFVTLCLTIVISFFYRPNIGAIHWNVIAILFSQMLVCIAFEECNLLQSLAAWIIQVFKTPKRLGMALVFFTGVLAMLITNDIALFTVVPITLSVSRLTGRAPHMLVILETVSANIFSAFTPFGNPQNLFLFTYYDIPLLKFFQDMLPFILLGTALLAAAVPLLCRGGWDGSYKQRFSLTRPKLLTAALVIFCLNILAVIRIVDYRIAFIISAAAFIVIAPRLFRKVDFVLLMTFILFFLFTDALTSMPAARQFFSDVLNSKQSVMLGAAALSQVISNVPASVVLAGFTDYYRELLYGVSAGGLGTLIASLASLISYKLYVKEYSAEKRTYLKWFYLLNTAFLIIMLAGLTVFELFLP